MSEQTQTGLAVGGYSRDQIALIKRTILSNDTTDDELTLFVGQCQRTGLDPFSRQIYGIKRKGKLTIQVGIDGMRLIAERTGQLDGQEGPWWCGEDGVWRDVWLSKNPPLAAKVTVHRKGQGHGYTGVAHLSEFYQAGGAQLWDKMPAVMLAKVAESIALRKGFPQELSGIYAEEEMNQAEPTDRSRQLPAASPTAAARARFAQRFDDVKTRPHFDVICDDLAKAKAAGDLTDDDLAFLRPLARKAASRFPAPANEPEPADTEGQPA